MSGKCEFEAGDGEKVIRKAGDFILLEDTPGRALFGAPIALEDAAQRAIRSAIVYF